MSQGRCGDDGGSHLGFVEFIGALGAALRGLKGTGEISKRLARETIRLMNSEQTALLPIDPDGAHQRCYAAAGMFLVLVPKGQGLSWAAIESRTPIRLDQAAGPWAVPASPQAYSEIVVPLINSQGVPLGVLISARNGEKAYHERDVRLLQVIGNIAANTLERVRAGENLEAEVAEKTALLELSHMLGGNDVSCCRLRWRRFARWGMPAR